jgi:general secretion pathway protein K
MIQRPPGTREAGIALLTALLVVAVVSIAAVQMVSRQRLDIHRTGNILDSDRVWQTALGVEAWAVGQLIRDRKEGDTDYLGEDWARELPETEIEGGIVSGTIQDLQGRLNLNSLVAEDAKKQGLAKAAGTALGELLDVVKVNRKLAAPILDWIDRDINPAIPGGAEDGVYLARTPAYRTANAAMGSASELLLVEDMEPEDYAKLAPFVTALPTPTPINVNTAPVEVLRAAIPKLRVGDAEAIVTARELQPIENLTEFLKSDALAGLKVEPALLSVSSEYFLVEGTARQGLGSVKLTSILHRTEDKGIEVVYRSRSGI